jgi:ankyrin repeat protein
MLGFNNFDHTFISGVVDIPERLQLFKSPVVNKWSKHEGNPELENICRKAFEFLNILQKESWDLLKHPTTFRFFPGPVLHALLEKTYIPLDAYFQLWDTLPEDTKNKLYYDAYKYVLHVEYYNHSLSKFIDLLNLGWLEWLRKRGKEKKVTFKLLHKAISQNDNDAIEKLFVIFSNESIFHRYDISEHIISMCLLAGNFHALNLCVHSLGTVCDFTLDVYKKIAKDFLNKDSSKTMISYIPLLVKILPQEYILDILAKEGSIEILRELQKLNAYTIGNLRKGNSTLHMAQSKKGPRDLRLFETLIKLGENPNLRNDDGESPLACQIPRCTHGQEILDLLRLFKNNGADFSDGHRLLFLICKHRVPARGAAIQFLFENSTDIHFRGDQIINAAVAQYTSGPETDEVIEVLLGHGFSLSKVNNQELLFYLACRFGRMEILVEWSGSLPIKYNPNTFREKKDSSPAKAAIEKGHMEVLDYLFERTKYDCLYLNGHLDVVLAIKDAEKRKKMFLKVFSVLDRPSMSDYKACADLILLREFTLFAEVTSKMKIAGKKSGFRKDFFLEKFKETIAENMIQVYENGFHNIIDEVNHALPSCVWIYHFPMHKIFRNFGLLKLKFEMIENFSDDIKDILFGNSLLQLFSHGYQFLFSLSIEERNFILDRLFIQSQIEHPSTLNVIYKSLLIDTPSRSQWEEIKGRLEKLQISVIKDVPCLWLPTNNLSRYDDEHLSVLRDIVRFIWREKNFLLDGSSNSPLHRAVQCYKDDEKEIGMKISLAVVEELVALGHPLTVKDKRGQTPLTAAILNDNTSAAIYLLNKTEFHHGKKDLDVQLSCAIQKCCNLEILARIYQFPNLNVKDYNSQAYRVNRMILELVMTNLVRDKIGIQSIARMRQTSMGLKVFVDDIILQGRIFRNFFLSKPLGLRAFFRQKSPAKRLHEISYRMGHHPYDRSALVVDIIKSRTLIDELSVVYRPNRVSDLAEFSTSGFATIHFACLNENSIDSIASLLNKGADIDQPTAPEGVTPLCLAVQHGDIKLINFLIEKGACIEGLNWSKEPPLLRVEVLLLNDSPVAMAVIRLLLEKGANPFVRDENGNTLLHYAAEAGYIELIKELVRNWNFPLNIRNKKGMTPIMLSENFATVKTLLAFGYKPDNSNPNVLEKVIIELIQAMKSDNWEAFIQFFSDHLFTFNENPELCKPFINDIFAQPKVKSRLELMDPGKDLILKLITRGVSPF